MIKLSDYVWKFFEEKKIKHVFMLPGGGAMHLIDSVGNANIEKICFQHEQGAAIAAEAYAQHTNSVGLVLTTSGPGATNAITAVTAGWIDSTPMFVISGQAKCSDLVGDTGVRQIGSQEVQIIDMVMPITKYAVQIMKPQKIKYYLEKAYYEATTGRPGPVWLSVPLDIQACLIDEDSLVGFTMDVKKVSTEISEKIEEVLSLLEQAEKPLVLLGNGVKLAGADDLFYQFIKSTQIPVQTTWKTIDMMGENDPLYVGHPGIMGDRGANLILQEADLLVSIGSRVDTSITAFNDTDFARNAKHIVVDIDENEIARMGMRKDIFIACDAKYFLKNLLYKISNVEFINLPEEKQRNRIDWLEHCHQIRSDNPVVTQEHKDAVGYVSAYYFIQVLCELLHADDVVVPESSGGAGEITYQAFKIKNGQKMKNAAGLGSMGFGLPYAIGSCLANDRRRTILINGDAAFQLNIQELETLHRLQLPVIIFIWNNDGYASIRAMQRNTFDGHYVASSRESGFSTPDTMKIAEAYGFKTFKIHNNQELDKMLPEIMLEDKPLLCELMVSPEETVSPRVKATVGENGKMIAGKLDVMWPFNGGV